MIIDCIADLHGYYPKLEGGDLLIVAGDLTARDTPMEHLDFVEWCRNLPYKKIIVISGNHDNFLQKLKSKYFGMPVYHDHCEYLCDSGTEFEGLKIWGSPWSLWFDGINPKCTAFTGDEDQLMDAYDKIPRDIDILITHTPAYGILDECTNGRHVGSKSLYGWLKYIGRPRLHICGHIHEAYGKDEVFVSRHNDEMMISVNCSVVNEYYENVNEPIRVIL